MQRIFMKIVLLAGVLLVWANVVPAQVPCTQQFPTALNTRSTLCDAGDSASTTIATSSINSSVTVVTVISTTKFPDNGVLVIDSEQMMYTSKTSTTFTIGLRGAYGTVAASHAIGATVKGALTAQHIHAQSDAQTAVETKLGFTPSGELNAPTGATQLLAGRGTGTSSWRTFAELSLPTFSGLTSSYFPYYNGSIFANGPLSRLSANGIDIASGGEAAPSTSDQTLGTRIRLYPGASGSHLGIGVESGAMWFNTASNNHYKFYYGASAAESSDYTHAGWTINSALTSYTINFNSSSGSGSALLLQSSDIIRIGPSFNTGSYRWDFGTDGLVPNGDNFIGIGTASNRVGTGFFGTGVFNDRGIADASLNSIVRFSNPGSPVNYLTMAGSATGSGVTIGGGGSDTNIDLNLTPKGSGKTLIVKPQFTLGSDATGDTFYRASGGLFTRLGIGSNGNCMLVASGLPSWGTCPTTSPGGSTTQVQYNNAGAFGGISGATTDGTNMTFGSSNLRATNARITGGFLDSNGNTMIGVSPTTSAVNYWSFSNSATGGSLGLGAAGTDTNIGMTIQSKGAGYIYISPGSVSSLVQFGDNGGGIALWHNQRVSMQATQWNMSDVQMCWNGTNYFGNGCDVGINRNAAGVMEVNNGSAGTLADLKVRNIVATGLNAFKSSDTARSSTTTLAADPHLSINLLAGKTYNIKVNLYHSYGLGFFQCDLGGGTATITHVRGRFSTWDDDALIKTRLFTSLTTVVDSGVTATEYEFTVTVNAAGTFAVRWSQISIDASSTTLLRGSSIVATQLN